MAVVYANILKGEMSVNCVMAVKYVVMEKLKIHAKNVSDQASVSTKNGDIVAKNVSEKGFVCTENTNYIAKNV